MFAVVVSLTLKPNQKDSFMPLMLTNARDSLSKEEGCRQFDVATDPAAPDEVLLYELYESAAAFDQHLASTHFRTFDTATADMIVNKSVKTFSEVSQ